MWSDFGYSREEWIGQHGSIIFTPADQAVALCVAELEIAREKGKAPTSVGIGGKMEQNSCQWRTGECAGRVR